MSIESPRRYYLLKSKEAARRFDDAMASVWLAKQLEEPGTPLESGFPFKSRLATVGYVAREDLVGATENELLQAGLATREAAAVLAAL